MSTRQTIRMAAVFAALLTGLLWGSAAHAATYYIDPVNGNDGWAGTSTATAVKTIRRGGQLADPGDTVKLRAGHYQVTDANGNPNGNVTFDAANWSGSAGNPITVEPYKSEIAVFDCGFSEFKTGSWRTPNNAWFRARDGRRPEIPPCPNAHEDEYVSLTTYDREVKWGHFLKGSGLVAGDKLLAYSRLEDLRAKQESDIVVPLSDPRLAGGPLAGKPTHKIPWCYRGPGLWWNASTGRIHIRLSHTSYKQPGVSDYTGETNPCKLPLGIYSGQINASSGDPIKAMKVTASYITFKNLILQGGGNATLGVSLRDDDPAVSYVTFDHCTINCGRRGVTLSNTNSVRFLNCVFDGRLPSYCNREEVKDGYDYIDDHGVSQHNGRVSLSADGLISMNGTKNYDTEFANCEIRNGHDGIFLSGNRTRFHHNLVENNNDEALIMNAVKNVSDVRVYNNVVRRAVQMISHAKESGTFGGVYLFRNIFDNRLPTLSYRQFPNGGYNDKVNIWRWGYDYKTDKNVGESIVYQNTFVYGSAAEISECSAVFIEAPPSDTRPRRFMNNIHMTIGNDRPIYTLPDPASPCFADGNDWCRRLTVVTAPLYNSLYNNSKYADYEAMHASGNWNSWDNHTIFEYPQFADVPDLENATMVGYTNADFRLKSTSPARGAGVDLTGMGWPDSEVGTSTPDIGALPYGADVLAVGVDGRYVFPDSTTPVAEAGGYSTVPDVNNNGFETVTLDATGSKDPDGSISKYKWKLNGCTISTASTASVALPTGTSKVYLTVTDDSGTSATDMREITVTGYENAVYNPGFESGSTAWTLNGGASIVTSPAYFSCQALKLVGLGLGGYTTESSAQQLVPLTPGIPLTISGWAKTVGLPAGKYFSYKLVWLNSTGGTISGTMIDSKLGGTNDWTLRTATFTPPAGAFTAKIQPTLEAGPTGGTAYFDNACIVVGNKIRNPYFEKGLSDWVAYGGHAAITTASGNVRSGAMSLALTVPVYVVQKVMGLTGGSTNYTFSGWVKTVDMANSAEILIQWLKENGNGMGAVPIGSSTGTSDGFVQITASKPKPDEAVGVLVKLHAVGTGTCYFDDIVVRKGR